MLKMMLAMAVIAPLSPALAQQGATVAGRTVDSTSHAPVAMVRVVLLNATSRDTVSATVTRADGRFLIRGLVPGRYTVTTRYPGIAPTEQSLVVSALNPSYDLGDILVGRLQTISGVTVSADAEQTAAVNSEVYRIGEGAAATTGSIADALKNLPGITVDQEGRVLLRGSDKVAILIDGRQSSLTGLGSQRALDNIPAANIEAVEIIHNPSARLDAAGMAGIINIVYKQERRLGLSGDASLSLGVGEFNRQRADLPTDLGSFANNEKFIPSLNLNYTTPRARAFLFYSALMQRDLPNNEFTTRFYDDGRVIESQVPENRRQSQNIVRLGADFGVGSANVFSIAGLYDTETHTDSAQVPFILQSTGQRQRYWFWRERESNGIASVALNWKRSFRTPGHGLNVNLQFSRVWEDEAYFVNEESPVRTGSDATHVIAPENTAPLTIDYVRPLQNGRLELGGKLQRRWLPITYEVERGNQSVIYPGLGDHTDWEEGIVAGYANLVRIGESYTLEAGVRIEQTDVTYTVPDENIYYDTGDAYDYFEIFPNFNLTRTLNRSLRLIAAYNRRVDRPSEQELRIFPKYDDPELLKVGNPYLRPQLTQVIELGLNGPWWKGSTTVSAYHRDITDAFQRIYAIDNTNPDYDIINKLYQNVGRATQTGIQVVADQQLAPSWRLAGSVNWYVHDIDSISTTLFFPVERPFFAAGSRDNTWDLSLNNRFTFAGGQEIQLSFINYAARNAHQGREWARSSLDLAASWPLARERGDVTFTFTDMLANFGVRREFAGQGFTALYENLKETQTARVRMRVRF